MDNNEETIFDPKLIAEILVNQKVRREIARKSHLWFFALYFSKHIFYKLADFHREIFNLTQSKSNKLTVITAFRSSGKTTILSQSFPIWAITGILEKKYVIIVSKTAEQAKNILKNIKMELEENEILKTDLGPFKEESEEWKSYSLIFKNCQAKIMAISYDQAMRGTKFGCNRPDLIIIDDVEDLSSVRSQDARDKTYEWFKGDVIPSGDKGTQIYVIGNLLHQDSLIMRLKRDIESKKINGIFKEYPIKDRNNQPMWPGKFPNIESINELKKTIGDDTAFKREYELNPFSKELAIIKPEWIKKMDKIPESEDDFKYYIASVDPAFTTNKNSCYTAIITAKVYNSGDKLRIYILPNPLNYKGEFTETVEKLKNIYREYRPKIIIESNGQQVALSQQLKLIHVPVDNIGNYGNDKRMRLHLASLAIKDQRVIFLGDDPTTELLINQLVYFDTEKEKDLVDALTMLILEVTGKDKGNKFLPEIFWI